MSIISLACTKYGISIVHTSGKKKNFRIVFHERLAVVQGEWITLVRSIKSTLQSRIKIKEPTHWVIVKASTGRFSATANTYKAEAFVEYVLAVLKRQVDNVAKQSLPKALGCARGEKWKTKAKQMFDAKNTMKGFETGFDAACAGAFSKAI